MNKKELAILISSLKGFENRDVKLEQYPTPGEIVADVLWNANSNNDIKNMIVADLGCGTGFFGYGALILGAKKVYFVDKDSDALNIAKENKVILENKLGLKFKTKFICSDVVSFDKKVDVVLQNPPFGVQEEHADRVFLEVAFEYADVVYSLHKAMTINFLKKFSSDNNFEIVNVYSYKFPLKASFKFHKSAVKDIDVVCVRFVKGNDL